jgi:phytoene/squalene synthetase
MDLYKRVSYELSRTLTLRYSSSFGLSSRLFSSSVQQDIYALYGLVRVADEIVDSYPGADRQALLDNLEAETYAAIQRGYSTNPIVHAFALTAAHYGIDKDLIAPFFKSMRMDLTPLDYTDSGYSTYIYGSAEVIGLMCLKIFCQGNNNQYDDLVAGARGLGAAYQKVNFLRDIASDYTDRGRVYFPGVVYDTFNDDDKQTVIASIKKDLTAAKPSLAKLPANSRAAVMLSVMYYRQLLARLEKASVTDIKTRRIRINAVEKLWLFVIAVVRYKVAR